jgi:predicted P-loop ATPase/5S rRNA maturation endonuclease (ribonuclease M5)
MNKTNHIVDAKFKPDITPADVSAVRNLSKSAFAELIRQIGNYNPFAILEPVPGKEGKECICPACGSGTHGKNNTGLVPTYDIKAGKWLFNCYPKHDFEGDLIAALAGLNGVTTKGDDFFKAVAITAKVCNISIQNDTGENLSLSTIDDCRADDVTEEPKSVIFEEDNEELQNLIAEDIQAAADNVSNLRDEDKSGFTAETLNYWKIGFCGKWTPPNSRLSDDNAAKKPYKGYPSARIIYPHLTNSKLPNIKLTYCAGTTKDHRRKNGDSYKYLYGGERTPFGLQTLTDDAEFIFATEGEKDAVSIWQATEGKYPVLATGGTALNGIFDALQTFYKRNVKIIYFTDNDEPGTKFSKDFKSAATKAGFSVYVHFFAESDAPKLDANKILIEQGGAILAEKIDDAIRLAQVEFDRQASELRAIETAMQDEKFQFISSPGQRRDFLLLRKQPYSKERNAAMIQIIRDNLDWKIFKGKRQYILPSANNFKHIFNADDSLSDLFAYEEFSDKVIFLKNPVWSNGKNLVGEQWSDKDDFELKFYLRENYTDLAAPSNFSDVFISFAHRRAFNVVQRYFQNLPKWDGVPRAATLFIDHLKIEDTEYTRAVTQKWLLAAVARIFYPGCNFQSALVLHGNQGIGKSYVFEMLGGDWYGALNDSVDDSHAVDAIKNLWICELKEMSAARKSEINAVKSFIERSSDNYRAAYARRAQNYKRHCVFAISVNDSQFLRDTTGNRRYWILESPLEKFNYVEKVDTEYIKQVWAETFQNFQELTKDGFNSKILELPLEFKVQAEEKAEGYTVDDGLKSQVGAFLDIKIPPLEIWKLLTPTERYEYFKHNQFEIPVSDFDARVNDDKIKMILDAESEGVKTSIRKFGKYGEVQCYIFTGAEYRAETCAAEICQELFGNDKRQQIIRIAETLKSQMQEDWIYSGRQDKNFNSYYGRQKNIFKRAHSAELEGTDEKANTEIKDAEESKNLRENLKEEKAASADFIKHGIDESGRPFEELSPTDFEKWLDLQNDHSA